MCQVMAYLIAKIQYAFEAWPIGEVYIAARWGWEWVEAYCCCGFLDLCRTELKTHMWLQIFHVITAIKELSVLENIQITSIRKCRRIISRKSRWFRELFNYINTAYLNNEIEINVNKIKCMVIQNTPHDFKKIKICDNEIEWIFISIWEQK